MAIIYIDLENGNDSNDGSTWALAKKTLPVSGDDEYRIAKTDVYSLGQTAQWTNKSKTIILSTPFTKKVEDAIGNTWSFSGNVTGSAYSTYVKLGASCQNINEAAAFTTGKLTWKQLSNTEDYSGFTKIAFWFSVSNYAAANAKKYSICLCSDTNGDTVVNSFPLEDVFINNIFHCMVLDFGSPLGSSINSVAIYNNIDTAVAVSFRINHIIACNDFSLASLVGKSNLQKTNFYAIQSIVDDTITIDSAQLNTTTWRGYLEDTEEATVYIRKTFTDSIPLSYSITGKGRYRFGWDKATDEQTGETWFDGKEFSKTFISTKANYPVGIENLGLVRYGGAILINDFTNIYNIQITACFGSSFIFRINTSGFDADHLNCHNNYCRNSIFEIRGGYPSPMKLSNMICVSNYAGSGETGAPLLIYSSQVLYNNILVENNDGQGVYIDTATPQGRFRYGYGNIFKNLISQGNQYPPMICYGSENYFIDSYIETSPRPGIISYRNYLIGCNLQPEQFQLFQYNINKEGGMRVSASSYGYMEWQTTVKYGSELGAWKIFGNLPNKDYAEGNFMTNVFKLAEIAVEGGVPLFITANIFGYVNLLTYYGCRLLIRSIISDLVDEDIEAIIPPVEEWHKIPLLVTPKKTGVLRLEVQVLNALIYVGSIDIKT